jgi:hypothetical protein
MNRQMLPPMRILVRRFAVPIVSVWLLHMGIWMIVVILTQPLLSAIFGVVNWCIEHFSGGNTLEYVSWSLSSTAVQIGEGMIPVALGLLLGFSVLYRKRQKKASA